jgi:hypothetical protein
METQRYTDHGDLVQPEGPHISCYPSGKTFFLDSPTFDIEDIAHSLGNLCRYNGHIRHFYSVAEHSVIVSLLMEELKLGDPLEGLLHDAHEAYVADVVSPWKSQMPDWRKIEKRIEAEMRDNFSLPTASTGGCHTADSLALFIEGHYLKVDKGLGLVAKVDCRPQAMKLIDAGWRTLNLLPTEATKAFLKRWHALRG